MMRALAALWLDESASTLVEYGIVLAAFSAVATAVLVAISTSANTAYSQVSNAMQSFQTATPP